jgi:hypothetical protein
LAGGQQRPGGLTDRNTQRQLRFLGDTDRLGRDLLGHDTAMATSPNDTAHVVHARAAAATLIEAALRS